LEERVGERRPRDVKRSHTLPPQYRIGSRFAAWILELLWGLEFRVWSLPASSITFLSTISLSFF
jgi:hypothetical protein